MDTTQPSESQDSAPPGDSRTPTPLPRRAAGLLLHPTSFPNRFPVGDLGPGALTCLDWMRDAGLTVWQILPLGPPAIANAPYTALSAFAGNPLLISPERLVDLGLLDPGNLDGAPESIAGRVAYDSAIPWKEDLLRRAWEHFRSRADDTLRHELDTFSTAQAHWLEDWALFATLRQVHPEPCWWLWPEELRRRDPGALAQARNDHADTVAYHRFVQWIFFRQWGALRAAAAERGLEILGDLPIYVGLDSAEVWAQRHFFELDDDGRPLAVAGVPPDYFSPTGQLWGNPLYRWDVMAEHGFEWWIDRLRANLELVDRIRLDHFRGFAGYWRVPAGEDTAVNGAWVDGPGAPFFDALRAAFGDLPIIAEDLGEITDDVHALRQAFELPCMRVLHFGFGDDAGEHAPHGLAHDTAFYTGTHDNETTLGWYRNLDDDTRYRMHLYAGLGDSPAEYDAVWAMIRLVLTSVAQLAVVPLQDVLCLGNDARMNTPGVAEGNWDWRVDPGQITAEHAHRLRELVRISRRLRQDPE